MSVMRTSAWSCLGASLLGVIALSACGTMPPPSTEHKSDPPAVDPSVVHSLQRQIRERDKRIAELESQLEALKVIDQDMDEMKKQNRLPATLTPLGTDPPQ